jgi:uncharacterized membrane protein
MPGDLGRPLGTPAVQPPAAAGVQWDPETRVVVPVLVATFVMAVTALRHLRADTRGAHLALLVVMASGLASLAKLLGFITHIVRFLRVDTMMATVQGEAQAAIETFYPRYGDPPAPRSRMTTPSRPARDMSSQPRGAAW